MFILSDGDKVSRQNSSYFTPEKPIIKSKFPSNDVIIRKNSGRKWHKPGMTTFGKDEPHNVTNSDIENSVKQYLDSVHYESSPIVVPEVKPGIPFIKLALPLIHCLSLI